MTRNRRERKFRISNLLSEEHITKSANKKRRRRTFCAFGMTFLFKKSRNEYGNCFWLGLRRIGSFLE
jgi:hypothetical protein